MSKAPEVVVVDDGELEDIRVILDELGVEFTHWAKGDVPRVAREPGRLLVTTASHAVSLRYQRPLSGDPREPKWVVVASSGSRTQRRKLLQAGFNFLVRRPVHPAALRLLLQRAVYSGDERRRGARVAVGYEIGFRSGLWPRRATLVDLSPRGCRLLTRHPIDPGSRVRLDFPPQIAQGVSFTHEGTVLRVRRGELEGGEEGEISVAIRLDGFTEEGKERMLAILRGLARGPASLPRQEAEATQDATAATTSEPSTRAPRGIYERQVRAFGEAEFVLLGRDLSSGGMRVESHPSLSVGDSTRLMIETGTDEDPVVVGAEVIRDDGERGQALCFQWVEYGAEERLDALVRSLTPIEQLTPQPESGQRLVLSRLLPQLVRIPRRGR